MHFVNFFFITGYTLTTTMDVWSPARLKILSLLKVFATVQFLIANRMVVNTKTKPRKS